MNREPNEIDADEYNDRLFAEEVPERDVDADYDAAVDAELMEKAKPYGGSLIADCASVVKAAVLQAHSDFCLANGLKQPQSVTEGDGKDIARERLMGYDRNAPSNYSEFGR